MKTAINFAAIVGAASTVLTFIMERSSCLSIPDWVSPILATAAMTLTWLVKSPFAQPTPAEPAAPKTP